MNFLTIKTRVAELSGMDLTTDSTTIGAWVNGAYQHISGVFNWPWLVSNTIVQTKADITTGTVSINAGDTALTFSSGPSVSVANDWMIKIPTVSNDWYFITAHTAASTSATISVPLVGISNVVAGSYTLRKVFYSLPSDVDRIMDFRQAVTKDKLEYIDPRTLDRILPDPVSVGTPLYYSLVGQDSSQNWRCTLLPTPNATVNLQLRYYKSITELSADADIPLVPTKWHNALVFGALALYGYMFIDDSRYAEAAKAFETIMEEMTLHNSHVPDQRVVIQPWDTRPRTGITPLRWPSDFPERF